MIIGVATWRGRGATTASLCLASGLVQAGLGPWLVEADPAGGVLAARMPGVRAHAGGLERLAFPAVRSAQRERFDSVAVEVAGIRVIAGPGDPFRAWACHQPRVPWAAALRDLHEPVVVDLGSLRGGSPVGALLDQLDALLLVTTCDVVDIAASVDWATHLGRVAPGIEPLALDITRLVVVDSPGASERVSHARIESELGDRFAAWLPWSPKGIATLCDGTRLDDRRLRRDPIGPASRSLADGVIRRVGLGVTA